MGGVVECDAMLASRGRSCVFGSSATTALPFWDICGSATSHQTRKPTSCIACCIWHCVLKHDNRNMTTCSCNWPHQSLLVHKLDAWHSACTQYSQSNAHSKTRYFTATTLLTTQQVFQSMQVRYLQHHSTVPLLLALTTCIWHCYALTVMVTYGNLLTVTQ